MGVLGKVLGVLAMAGMWQPQLLMLNGVAPASRQPANASHAAATTFRFMQGLTEHFVSSDGRLVSYRDLENSAFYKKSFQEFGSLLHNVDPAQMEAGERKSFFINLYNILTIHAIVQRDPLPSSTISIPSFWQRYAYKVGPYTLHLDHIEHGLLRGNRAHPTSGAVMFRRDDPRGYLALPFDRRVHAALNCGAMSCPPLRAFSPEGVEGELEDAMTDFCNKAVSEREENGALVINSIFKWFKTDFGATEGDVLRWLADCATSPATSRALRQAALGDRSFSYDYNWSLNAAS